MSLNYYELIGNIYGRSEIIGLGPIIPYGSHNRTRQQVLCLCECGTPYYVSYSSLQQNKTISCGCFRREGASERKRLLPGEASLRATYGNYKSRAKKIDKSFELTLEEFEKLTNLNCDYCGSAPSTRCIRKNYYGTSIGNGLDRVDNNLGYTTENVVPCCILCNKAKGSISYEDFIKWLNNLCEFRTNNEK